MDNAPPSIDTFFINMVICIWAILGSVTPQNLCITTVTGTRKSTISQEPNLVRYPKKMLKPPASAMIPDSGTATEAKGRPCAAA